MSGKALRIGRLVLGWGPSYRLSWIIGKPIWLGFTPFAPYLWRVFYWKLCVGWLVSTWKEPRRMSRQERRQVERKLRAGKSVVFSNVQGRKR